MWYGMTRKAAWVSVLGLALGGAAVSVPVGGADVPVPLGGADVPVPLGGADVPVPLGGADVPVPLEGTDADKPFYLSPIADHKAASKTIWNVLNEKITNADVINVGRWAEIYARRNLYPALLDIRNFAHYKDQMDNNVNTHQDREMTMMGKAFFGLFNLATMSQIIPQESPDKYPNDKYRALIQDDVRAVGLVQQIITELMSMGCVMRVNHEYVDHEFIYSHLLTILKELELTYLDPEKYKGDAVPPCTLAITKILKSTEAELSLILEKMFVESKAITGVAHERSFIRRLAIDEDAIRKKLEEIKRAVLLFRRLVASPIPKVKPTAKMDPKKIHCAIQNVVNLDSVITAMLTIIIEFIDIHLSGHSEEAKTKIRANLIMNAKILAVNLIHFSVDKERLTLLTSRIEKGVNFVTSLWTRFLCYVSSYPKSDVYFKDGKYVNCYALIGDGLETMPVSTLVKDVEPFDRSFYSEQANVVSDATDDNPKDTTAKDVTPEDAGKELTLKNIHVVKKFEKKHIIATDAYIQQGTLESATATVTTKADASGNATMTEEISEKKTVTESSVKTTINDPSSVIEPNHVEAAAKAQKSLEEHEALKWEETKYYVYLLGTAALLLLLAIPISYFIAKRYGKVTAETE